MGYDVQAGGIIHHAFLQNLYEAFKGNGIIDGLVPTVTPATMQVNWTAGHLIANGVLRAVAAGNLTLSDGDGSNPRQDALIWDDSALAIAVREGSPTAETSTQRKPPLQTMDPGDLLVAQVYVAQNETQLATTDIFDRRCEVKQTVSPVEMLLYGADFNS